MAVSKLATERWALNNQAPRSLRRYQPIQYFIVHHAATTTDDGLRSQYVKPSRYLSSNYALKRDGGVAWVLDEQFIPATTNHAIDGQAVTIECVNQTGAPSWAFSDVQFRALAALIADVATRNNFPINRTHIRMHSDYQATACPGPWMQARFNDLIALARSIQAGGTTTTTPSWQKDEDTMFLIKHPTLLRWQVMSIDANGKPRAVLTLTSQARANEYASRFGKAIVTTALEYAALVG